MTQSEVAVFRYHVPVAADDRWHTVKLSGEILHVATRNDYAVEFWATHNPELHPTDRKFRVFGTGEKGVEGKYIGTAIRPGGYLVWHLFERLH